jgi:DNA repair exonuclease SbcCD ATPase subunit
LDDAEGRLEMLQKHIDLLEEKKHWGEILSGLENEYDNLLDEFTKDVIEVRSRSNEDSLPELNLVSGKRLVDVTVREITEEGLQIVSLEGPTMIQWSELTDNWIERWRINRPPMAMHPISEGGYDDLLASYDTPAAAQRRELIKEITMEIQALESAKSKLRDELRDREFRRTVMEAEDSNRLQTKYGAAPPEFGIRDKIKEAKAQATGLSARIRKLDEEIAVLSRRVERIRLGGE